MNSATVFGDIKRVNSNFGGGKKGFLFPPFKTSATSQGIGGVTEISCFNGGKASFCSRTTGEVPCKSGRRRFCPSAGFCKTCKSCKTCGRDSGNSAAKQELLALKLELEAVFAELELEPLEPQPGALEPQPLEPQPFQVEQERSLFSGASSGAARSSSSFFSQKTPPSLFFTFVSFPRLTAA